MATMYKTLELGVLEAVIRCPEIVDSQVRKPLRQTRVKWVLSIGNLKHISGVMTSMTSCNSRLTGHVKNGSTMRVRTSAASTMTVIFQWITDQLWIQESINFKIQPHRQSLPPQLARILWESSNKMLDKCRRSLNYFRILQTGRAANIRPSYIEKGARMPSAPTILRPILIPQCRPEEVHYSRKRGRLKEGKAYKMPVQSRWTFWSLLTIQRPRLTWSNISSRYRNGQLKKGLLQPQQFKTIRAVLTNTKPTRWRTLSSN